MKQKIANWLRLVADKLTGEPTVAIAITREFEYPFNVENNQGVVEEAKKAVFDKEREWVRESIIMGVRKASYDDGIFHWKERTNNTGGTITAYIRIISPAKVKMDKAGDDVAVHPGNERYYYTNRPSQA